MERVALYLQTKAINSKAIPEDFDLFARSAFNRYYYSMFLIVRDMLTVMSKDWKEMKHAAIPDLLNKTVVDRLRQAAKQATKIGDTPANRLCNQAIFATKGVADLMREGYASRVVADYEPGERVILSPDDRFTLNKVSINDAHTWPIRTRKFTPIILRAWKLT